MVFYRRFPQNFWVSLCASLPKKNNFGFSPKTKYLYGCVFITSFSFQVIKNWSNLNSKLYDLAHDIANFIIINFSYH